MASAIDDAIDYLDHLIHRFTSSQHSLVDSHKKENTKHPKEEKQAKKSSSKNAEAKVQPATSCSETEEMFSKAQIQVGCVLEVSNHPDSEKLFLCKVEVAKGDVRQVVAGLRKFMPAAELQGKRVCVVANLKPAKLAGHVSEAMILAGESPGPSGQLIVKVLEVPMGSSTGERVVAEGLKIIGNPVKQLSSKIWEKILTLLKVEDGIAKFDGKPLVTAGDSESIKVPEISCGSIH